MTIKLDMTIESPQERLKVVENYLEENPHPDERTLEILADYLVYCMEKQEKREKKILTENRLATIKKRETSLEGTAAKFINGEDGLHSIISNEKHLFLQPKYSITKQDLEDIPYLREQKKVIEFWDNVAKTTTGRESAIAKKAKIEASRDQYVIKDAYKPPMISAHLIHSDHTQEYPESVTFDEEGYPIGHGASLMRPEVNAAILGNYSKLKQKCATEVTSDLWLLMDYFDDVSGRALEPYPMYYRLVELKVDGLTNVEIQDSLQEEFGIKHSVEYISSLWRNKIPYLIASKAQDDYLNWYYLNEEKGRYKRCSRCGRILLAHPKYFSKNNTSKDGFYSVCKQCRNHGKSANAKIRGRKG